MGKKRSIAMRATGEPFDGRWKDLAQMATVALGLIAEGLHRIADALEADEPRDKEQT